MKTTTGYYVFCPTGKVPSVIHETIELAQREAKRLAKNNPGAEFVVLKRMQTFKAKQQVTVETY